MRSYYNGGVLLNIKQMEIFLEYNSFYKEFLGIMNTPGKYLADLEMRIII